MNQTSLTSHDMAATIFISCLLFVLACFKAVEIAWTVVNLLICCFINLHMLKISTITFALNNINFTITLPLYFSLSSNMKC